MEIIDSILRMYPILILLYAILIQDVYLIFFLIMTIIINYILKYKITQPLLGNKNYPIIGSGVRPKNAKNCGIFKDPPGYKNNTYGMPSNHSQQAVVFSTYMILKDLEKNTLSPLKTIIYVLLALIIMYSRIYLNCHTIQQVIMGGVIGLITTLIGWIYTR